MKAEAERERQWKIEEARQEKETRVKAEREKAEEREKIKQAEALIKTVKEKKEEKNLIKGKKFLEQLETILENIQNIENPELQEKKIKSIKDIKYLIKYKNLEHSYITKLDSAIEEFKKARLKPDIENKKEIEFYNELAKTTVNWDNELIAEAASGATLDGYRFEGDETEKNKEFINLIHDNIYEISGEISSTIDDLFKDFTPLESILYFNSYVNNIHYGIAVKKNITFLSKNQMEKKLENITKIQFFNNLLQSKIDKIYGELIKEWKKNKKNFESSGKETSILIDFEEQNKLIKLILLAEILKVTKETDIEKVFSEELKNKVLQLKTTSFEKVNLPDNELFEEDYKQIIENANIGEWGVNAPNIGFYRKTKDPNNDNTGYPYTYYKVKEFTKKFEIFLKNIEINIKNTKLNELNKLKNALKEVEEEPEDEPVEKLTNLKTALTNLKTVLTNEEELVKDPEEKKSEVKKATAEVEKAVKEAVEAATVEVEKAVEEAVGKKSAAAEEAKKINEEFKKPLSEFIEFTENIKKLVANAKKAAEDAKAAEEAKTAAEAEAGRLQTEKEKAEAEAKAAEKAAEEEAAARAKAAAEATKAAEKQDKGSSNWYPSPYPTVIIKKLEE